MPEVTVWMSCPLYAVASSCHSLARAKPCFSQEHKVVCTGCAKETQSVFTSLPLPGDRAGVKQSKWGLSPLQMEGDPNFPSDACHASSWRLVPTELGGSLLPGIGKLWAETGIGLWERCSRFPGPARSPLTFPVLLLPSPSSNKNDQCRSSTSFASGATAVKRSAVSRGWEGTRRDLATVAYTVQNNFLLL